MRGWDDSAATSLRTNASLMSSDGRSTRMGSAPRGAGGAVAVAVGAAGAVTATDTGACGRSRSTRYARKATSPTMTTSATSIHGLNTGGRCAGGALDSCGVFRSSYSGRFCIDEPLAFTVAGPSNPDIPFDFTRSEVYRGPAEMV